MSNIIGQVLEQVISRRIPLALRERISLVVQHRLPVLELTNGTTHILLSIDYNGIFPSLINFEIIFVILIITIGPPHIDHRDRGYAWAVWWTKHSPSCTGCQPDTWAFLFPEYNIAVPLQAGTCIVWRSNKVVHCTLLHKGTNVCKDFHALAIVTQIKQDLIDRMKYV